MDEEKQEQKKELSRGTAALIIIGVIIVTVALILHIVNGAGGSSTGYANARYVGSNRHCEIEVMLNSNQSCSVKVTNFGTGRVSNFSGTYEFLGTEGKVIKFSLSDGYTYTCERMVATTYEYISMSSIDSYFPAVYRK